MKTEKRKYLDLCLGQDAEWISSVAGDPSGYMRPIHVKIARLSLRIKRSGYLADRKKLSLRENT